MSQSFLTRRERARTRRLWLAAAASVLLVVGSLAPVLLPQMLQADLERELLALVQAADYALENREAIDNDSVARALAPVGYRVAPSIGAVSFAGRCLVRGSLAGHLVVREHDAPVTVFLVPHLEIDGQPRFGNREWSGLILRSRGRGAIVVVAATGADLTSVVERVLDAVDQAV